jgi:hypothetical protein
LAARDVVARNRWPRLALSKPVQTQPMPSKRVGTPAFRVGSAATAPIRAKPGRGASPTWTARRTFFAASTFMATALTLGRVDRARLREWDARRRRPSSTCVTARARPSPRRSACGHTPQCRSLTSDRVMVAPTQRLTCDRTNEAYGKGDAENDHDMILPPPSGHPSSHEGAIGVIPDGQET